MPHGSRTFCLIAPPKVRMSPFSLSNNRLREAFAALGLALAISPFPRARRHPLPSRHRLEEGISTPESVKLVVVKVNGLRRVSMEVAKNVAWITSGGF